MAGCGSKGHIEDIDLLYGWASRKGRTYRYYKCDCTNQPDYDEIGRNPFCSVSRWILCPTLDVRLASSVF